jgi:NADP-dependent 3-hydroxy acid dehydrogenase YdfG
VSRPLVVLIVGGYGTFGGRLARLLSDQGLTLLVGGRSLGRAQQFCSREAHQTPAVPARRPA